MNSIGKHDLLCQERDSLITQVPFLREGSGLFLLKGKMGCGRYCEWLEAGGSNMWPFSRQKTTKERNLPRLLLGVQPFFTSAQNAINRTFLGVEARGGWWGGEECCLF